MSNLGRGWSKHSRKVVSLLAIAAVLGSCTDDGPTPPAREEGAVVRGASVSGPTIDELGRQGEDGEFLPRLDPRIEVVGDLVPGSPLRVRFSGELAEDAESAHLKLYTPQIPGVRARPQGPSGPVRYSAAAEAHRAAPQRGQVAEGTRTVVFQEEGMYHLQVVAEAPRPGPRPDIEARGVIDLWVMVLDEGGAVYPDFRTDVFPEGAVPGIGPLRWYMGQPRREASLASAIPSALRALLPRQGNVYFDVRYSYDGSDLAAVGAKAEIQL
ncbi:MAG: hypothetical protein RLN75_07915 [Longimicrobiales bacterium]